MRKKNDRKNQQHNSNDYIRYVKEVPDEQECPDCGGSGYDPWDGGQCDRCGGTGTVQSKNNYY